MKLGAKQTIGGNTYHCVSHTREGQPILADANGRRVKRPAAKQVATYEVGEAVRIVGLMPGLVLAGEVTRAWPVAARVTTAHPVWSGAEVKGRTAIRKARQG